MTWSYRPDGAFGKRARAEALQDCYCVPARTSPLAFPEAAQERGYPGSSPLAVVSSVLTNSR